MTRQRIVILILPAFLCLGIWRVASRMTPDAMGLATGVVFGVPASGRTRSPSREPASPVRSYSRGIVTGFVSAAAAGDNASAADVPPWLRRFEMLETKK